MVAPENKRPCYGDGDSFVIAIVSSQLSVPIEGMILITELSKTLCPG